VRGYYLRVSLRRLDQAQAPLDSANRATSAVEVKLRARRPY